MGKRTYEIARAEEEAVAHVQAMALRLLRSKGMKRRDLAKAMEVSESHISQLLTEDPKNLSIKKAARLFHHLDEELVISCRGIDELDRIARAKHSRAFPALACANDEWTFAHAEATNPSVREKDADEERVA